MTIASETNRSGPYSCNGATTSFPYSFKIYDEKHIAVVLTDAKGNDTILTLGTDYAVSGVGEDGGGAITTTTVYAAGNQITLLMDVPFTQEVDLQNQGAFYAETIEQALDLATQRALQLKELIARAVVLPVSSSVSTEVLSTVVLALNDIMAEMLTLVSLSDDIKTVAGISGAVSNAEKNASTATSAATAAQASEKASANSATSAAASAAAAQTWNPTTYYTKVQCDAQYFPLDGSGVVQGIIYAQSGARLGYSRLAGTNQWTTVELYQPEAAGSSYGVSLMGKFRGVAKVAIDAKDHTDGGAYWRFSVTPPGDDTTDRRSIAGFILPDGTLSWNSDISTTGGFVGDGSQLSNVGIVQSVSAVYSASTALTAVIPSDSTIPQVTEGTQILSVTITPKLATSKLRVRFSGSCAVSAANRATAALFVNGAANAVDAVSMYLAGTGNGPLAMEYEFAPGSTTAQTITVRVGPESGNLYMNNAGNTSYYTLGGIMKSMLVVEEVK